MRSMRAHAVVGDVARGRARTRRMRTTTTTTTRASAPRGCPSPSHGARENQQSRRDGVKAQNARFDARASAVDASAVRGRAETTTSSSPTTTTSSTTRASESRQTRTTSERARRRIKMRDVRCVVLAGGADETNPLTKNRARSAMRLGGPYRVIDFPMTNLINSGRGKCTC